MRVVYYALRPLKVGDEIRQVGDLVPEAASWAYLSGYVQDGHLAPVLVATLPDDVQMTLLEWEAEQEAAAQASPDDTTDAGAVATPTASGHDDNDAEKPQNKATTRSQKEKVA